jgi:agmatinase
MKIYKKQFLGTKVKKLSFQDAQVILIPFCYEGGISYGKGTSKGPDAIIDASHHLESYDEVLDLEPCTIGICTIEPPKMPSKPKNMIKIVYQVTKKILKQDKFIISMGGDHSITTGYCKAVLEKYGNLSVVQIDAHADLRHSYQGSIFNHACVMSRIREMTKDTVQIGIRSMSKEEARRIKDEQISVCTMSNYRNGDANIDSIIKELPDPVFLTFDVDAFDWSVIRSTGTPEPGGFLWDEVIEILSKIFSSKKVVALDIVELIHNKNDPNSAFAVAKLIYKMIGFKFFG